MKLQTLNTLLGAAALWHVVNGQPICNNTNDHPFWSRHAFMPFGPRQEHSVVTSGKLIYAIGGVRYNETYDIVTTNRIEVYDTQARAWHVAAPLPLPVNHPNAAGVDGKVFVLGALSAGGNWTAVPNAYVYTPTNDSWQGIAPLPAGTERGSSAVAAWNDTIYLAGGMQFLEIIPPFQQNSVSWVSSYNVRTNTWNTKFPSLPQPRQHVAGVVVGSTFYVIGGRENGVEQYHNTTYALDLTNPVEWTERAPMPTARGSLACAALGTVIYCFGGEGDPSNVDRIFDEVEAYDTESDRWYKLPPMELPRHGTGAATIDGRIWIPGGGIRTAMLPVGVLDSFEPGVGVGWGA